jgi:hypothetical protein
MVEIKVEFFCDPGWKLKLYGQNLRCRKYDKK